MNQCTVAQRYINLMAKAFQILCSVSGVQLILSKATAENSGINDYVKSQFDEVRKQDLTVLLNVIQELLSTMIEAPPAQQLSYAAAICLCMDQQICYADVPNVWESGRLCLHSLVPIQSDKHPVVVTTLNDNWEETGVCIAPKFPVSMAQVSADSHTVERALTSRDALYGINDKLENVSYYPWVKNTPTVQHIILPERPLHEEGILLPEETRIVFSPLTDRADLLNTNKCLYKGADGIPFQGVSVEGITDPEYVEECFTNSWLASCEKSPDIFFAPEMLATDKMVCVEHNGSQFLKPLLTQATLNGWKVPRLTIMPTYWKNRSNSLLIFDETGRHLGIQFKRFPYVDERNGCMEALDWPPAKTDVLMIHMKNQQRIAIVICAEFLLGMKPYVSEFLCSQLGATLILVPSYSLGDQDFVSALSALKPYGTSVVWGNCCGAVPHKGGQTATRIIGGCSYAGIDEQTRLGSVSECAFHCGECKTCFFMVNIPTRILLEKPDSPQAPTVFHIHH